LAVKGKRAEPSDETVEANLLTTKNQKRLLIVSAFDWDGMGGNIGGLSVYVLALMIMYYPLVDWQWIESELPVTHKVAPKQSIFKQYATGISRGIERLKRPEIRESTRILPGFKVSAAIVRKRTHCPAQNCYGDFHTKMRKNVLQFHPPCV